MLTKDPNTKEEIRNDYDVAILSTKSTQDYERANIIAHNEVGLDRGSLFEWNKEKWIVLQKMFRPEQPGFNGYAYRCTGALKWIDKDGRLQVRPGYISSGRTTNSLTYTPDVNYKMDNILLHDTDWSMIAAIQQDGDSIGGIVECRITGMPIGVGEPIFDKLQAHLAFAMMSINACKGFEYGSGFEGVNKKGSEMYLSEDTRLISGGIAGGISDGTPIVFRCVFKPTASSKKTFEARGERRKARGRHDACVAVRAVPVVEAMAAMVLADWHDF